MSSFALRITKPSFWLPLVLVVGGVLFAGCGATAPVVESITTPDTLQTDESGSFQATIKNQDKADEPLTYEWQFGNGEMNSGRSTTHAYGSSGQYTVRFKAENEGGADSTSAQVQVVRRPQPARITSINATPNPVDIGEQVRFSSNVQGDRPLTYLWEFGGGDTSSGASATYTYSSAGEYSVRLQASNDAGSASRSVTVNVERPLPDICRTVTEMSSAFFGPNSSTLTDEAKASLRENNEILSKCPDVTVRVEGFAAPDERNGNNLSADRTQAVAEFYQEQGVSQSRIMTRNEGEVKGVSTKRGGSRQYRRVDSIPERE